MTPDERRKVLEEVFEALTACPIVLLMDWTLGMRREDLSNALARLNDGVVPVPRDEPEE